MQISLYPGYDIRAKGKMFHVFYQGKVIGFATDQRRAIAKVYAHYAYNAILQLRLH